MKRKPQIDWTATADGIAKYKAARADAQRQANELGFDFGIERNDPFRYFRVFMLPQKSNRFGYEQRCEVVSCEVLARCQAGHGPCAR